MQFNFGQGSLWGIDLTASPPTPQQFGVLQDIDLEFSGELKELHGDKQFPVAVGRGKCKMTGKAKFAQINADVYATVVYGVTKTTGKKDVSFEEAGTIPGTPYQITVSQAANFSEDLGVTFTATGVRLTRVAASPATGQYSVSAGVYTFAAADTTLAVKISYTYTVSATGYTVPVTNQRMGTVPTFKAILNTIFGTQQFTLKLYKCVSSKLSLPLKQGDFTIMEFDFEVMADDSGNVFDLYVLEK
jgi:hypothetical protein